MTEPEAPEATSSPGASVGTKRRLSLSKSRRELTDEELQQSGVRLMLLDEVDRLDEEVHRLTEYEDKYHLADKQVGVLKEQGRKRTAVDIVYTVCVGIGVGLLMLSPTLPEPLPWLAAALGFVLLVSGITAKGMSR